MDETALSLSPKGCLVLAEKEKQVYDITLSSEKGNVTILIRTNAKA